VRKRLCKFNGVAVMRKSRGIGNGGNRGAGQIGPIVVCERKLEARSLVDGQRKRTRPVGAGRPRASEIGMEVHAVAPASQGGERSWSWAAVSLSRTAMGPPHLGQRQSGFGCLAGDASRSDCDDCSASSSRKQSGRRVTRRRLARKPKWRMRTKPLGSRCNRKRRRNSSSDRVINLCSLL